ncbi:MAG: hypothetical protein IPN69_15830 [Acidobacteria bacterium]|nr:hypothetical protein [Acidobacteriota bacterium]MBK8147893.1 hypothetical protein [Acidobacteriota bacterium]MBK8812180.1 hypothetical protein [Acidobacteriota bacterium]
MKSTIKCLFILFSAASALFAQTDKRIDAIRDVARQVDKMVAECESDGETSSTFLTELVANKNNGSYPAVGIYNTRVKFYYTYGDREKNPYPDRLLKIVIETKRSAMTESAEYLFDESRRLIFFFGKDSEKETRIYFAAGKMFKTMDGERAVVGNAANTASNKALAESRRLVAMFQESLRF